MFLDCSKQRLSKNQLKHLAYSLIGLFLFFTNPICHARVINISMVFDGPLKRNLLPVEQIKTEILSLTQNEFNVQFPSKYTVEGEWRLKTIRAAISQLNDDPSVDLILTNGLLASHEAAKFKHLNKPVIATVIADRVLQAIPYENGSSGRLNFTYIADNHTVEQDIRQLYELKPFKHLIVPADNSILKALPSLTGTVTQIQKELGFKLSLIPVYDDLNQALQEFPATGDAVYIPPLMRFSKPELAEFAKQISERKLPSFSLLGRMDLELGFLATLSGRKVDELRFSRRVALNVQSILLGTPAAELKIDLDQPSKLAINMEVANRIGLPIKWKVLEQAELLNDQATRSNRPITLIEAVNRAVAANLELQANQQNVEIARDNLDNARSTLLPQLNVSLSGNYIDQDRAGLFQAERTADADLQLSQLIYSERSWSNFDVAKFLKKAEDATFLSRVLDITKNSATAYLQVLLSKATEQVRLSDLQVSEANLELAQSRLKIGYSDRSDVLRWQSEIANDRSNVYFARSQREQAETFLKQLLYLPLKDDISVTDKGIRKQIGMLNDKKFNRFFNNPLSFDTFMAFEVERAFANAPEIKQIGHVLETSKRQLLAGQRAYYIPDVSLNARLGQNITQGGQGANNANFQQDNWSVGVQATLPLYTSGARSAEVSRAKHTLQQNQYLLDNTYLQIETRVRTALQKTKGSFPAIRLSKTAAEAAQRNLELISDAYAKGAVSITSLIDAQNAVLSAKLSAVQALYSFMIDWIEIQRAVSNFDLLLEHQGMENWYQDMENYFNNQQQ